MQNKLYIIAIIAFIAGGAAVTWAYLRNENETVPIMAPLVEATKDSIRTPATVMSNAERQAVKDRYMMPRQYFSPNEYDQGVDEDTSLFPAGYKRILSIPFHRGGEVLRVYSAVTCSLALRPGADCISDDVIVVRFNPQAKSSQRIATINAFHGANYGGVYVPLALTADDKNIILRAWMSSPGAGGSSIDLGYSKIPTMTDSASYATESLPRLASALAIFYDSYDKVVSLEESSKAFDWSQPGRNPNQGIIAYRNLVSGETKELADGTDMTYEIRSFSETDRTLAIQQIRYEFGVDCPRTEKMLDCAKPSATNYVIRVP